MLVSKLTSFEMLYFIFWLLF